MNALLWKDLLLLIRNKKQLFLIILVPFISTAILGFVLRDTTEILHIKLAIVQQDNETRAIEQFTQDLEAKSLSRESHDELVTAASTFQLSTRLLSFLNSQEMQEIIESVEMDNHAAEEALKKKEITAILTIPENFTYLTLKKILLHEGNGSKIHITVGDFTSIQAGALHQI